MFFAASIEKFIKGGDKRSVRLKKNIVTSFLIKGLSIAINFSIVPLTIDYVDSVQYGIWLTLTSIISWFTFFDFGMGNGLRNQLAKAVALNEYNKAQKYISTTYVVFGIIALSVFLLFFLVNPFINWNRFLNIPVVVDEDLHWILLLVLGCFCIQFVLQLLNTVLVALQEPAKADFITLLGQIGLLITLLIFKNNVKGSLSVLAIALYLSPLLVLTIASLLYYNRKLKLLAPSFKRIDFKYVRSIMNLGGTFFLIQIGAMILFQTDNIIIANILGPEAVTAFNVAYKLYSILLLLFSIIVTPYWSAFTEAYAKKDFEWINSNIKGLREIWLVVSLLVTPVFLLLSKYLFKLWLPDSVTIDFSLSMIMAVYIIFYNCLALNCYFLNGVGKLRLQLVLYLLVSITNIPLAIMLGKIWGVEGVISANIIGFLFMNLVLWIQTNKLLRQKAVGIWNA